MTLRFITRGSLIRLVALVVGSFLLAETGSAYYYFTYFASSAPPYTPIVARFDLTTLSNNTVPFFVSSAGPSAFFAGGRRRAKGRTMTGCGPSARWRICGPTWLEPTL